MPGAKNNTEIKLPPLGSFLLLHFFQQEKQEDDVLGQKQWDTNEKVPLTRLVTKKEHSKQNSSTTETGRQKKYHAFWNPFRTAHT